MFAKLYESNIGQILVKLDEGDKGPEVRFYFKPDLLGVCSLATQFDDTDSGWQKAESFFQKVDYEAAYRIASETLNKIGETYV